MGSWQAAAESAGLPYPPPDDMEKLPTPLVISVDAACDAEPEVSQAVRNSGVYTLKGLVKYLLLFVGGMALGAFLWSGQRVTGKTPVKVPFCFLMQNRSLFYGRQFLTSAHFMTTEHGAYLSDPECPDDIVTFAYSSPSRNGSAEDTRDDRVATDIAAHSFADVAFTFIGTVKSYSRFRVAVDWTKDRILKIPIKRPTDLLLDQIVSVGAPRARDK